MTLGSWNHHIPEVFPRMHEDITVRVRLSAKQFRSFCAFDTFRRKRRHLPILIVTSVLFTFGLWYLLFAKGGSGAVAGLLIGLTIAVPMVTFGLYVIQIESQVSRQGLTAAPEVYALHLSPDGVRISGLHRSSGTVSLSWIQIWAAYRARAAVYLYVSEDRAFILPDGQASVSDEKLWAYLCTMMGNEKCFVMKK